MMSISTIALFIIAYYAFGGIVLLLFICADHKGIPCPTEFQADDGELRVIMHWPGFLIIVMIVFILVTFKFLRDKYNEKVKR